MQAVQQPQVFSQSIRQKIIQTVKLNTAKTQQKCLQKFHAIRKQKLLALKNPTKFQIHKTMTQVYYQQALDYKKQFAKLKFEVVIEGIISQQKKRQYENSQQYKNTLIIAKAKKNYEQAQKQREKKVPERIEALEMIQQSKISKQQKDIKQPIVSQAKQISLNQKSSNLTNNQKQNIVNQNRQPSVSANIVLQKKSEPSFFNNPKDKLFSVKQQNPNGKDKAIVNNGFSNLFSSEFKHSGEVKNVQTQSTNSKGSLFNLNKSEKPNIFGQFFNKPKDQKLNIFQKNTQNSQKLFQPSKMLANNTKNANQFNDKPNSNTFWGGKNQGSIINAFGSNISQVQSHNSGNGSSIFGSNILVGSNIFGSDIIQDAKVFPNMNNSRQELSNSDQVINSLVNSPSVSKK